MDVVLILRYRKAVTYGFHVLLGALDQHETAISYDVRFAESAEATAAGIRAAADSRVLVLWSFYSPDAAALAEELARIRARRAHTTATDQLRGSEGYSMSGLEVRSQVRG